MDVAKKTSSSCIPTRGRKTSPRQKNRRGRIAAAHLNRWKLGRAVTVLSHGPQGSHFPQAGEELLGQKVISIHQLVTQSWPLTSFCGRSINVLPCEVDKTQMSGLEQQVGPGTQDRNVPKLQNFGLALELLRGCGMILGVKLLRTSPADGRCHLADCGLISPLSFGVHPSSVICCNSLNLSRGSRV
jgi:hypothetical protein